MTSRVLREEKADVLELKLKGHSRLPLSAHDGGSDVLVTTTIEVRQMSPRFETKSEEREQKNRRKKHYCKT